MTPTYIDILVLWLVFLAAYALIKTMIFQYQIEKIVKEIVIERRNPKEKGDEINGGQFKVDSSRF